MKFSKTVIKAFGDYYTESDFVEKTYKALSELGFTRDNTIACVAICRDEICQSLFEEVNRRWGYVFNLASLAGMLFAGKTGFDAAEHHSPNMDGRERYIFYAMPHIAIDADGRIGVYIRKGRIGESSACGALVTFQRELSSTSTTPYSAVHIDPNDIEMSLLRMRLIRDIPSGCVPELLELTKITQRVISADLERMISLTVDKEKSDYAVFTGIQVHGPEMNYVCSDISYSVVSGTRKILALK